MNTRQLLTRQLVAIGADGLVNTYTECGCDRDDLAPCGAIMLGDCVAAKKAPANRRTRSRYSEFDADGGAMMVYIPMNVDEEHQAGKAASEKKQEDQAGVGEEVCAAALDIHSLRLFVRNAVKEMQGNRPLWAHVKKLFLKGSTTAQAICRELGFDPDQTGCGKTEWEAWVELVGVDGAEEAWGEAFGTDPPPNYRRWHCEIVDAKEYA